MLREHKEPIGGVMFALGFVCLIGVVSTDDYHTMIGEHDAFFPLMVKMVISGACALVGAYAGGLIGGREHE